MCLSCLYGRFWKCSICGNDGCIELLYNNNNVCDSCVSKIQKRMCRCCKLIFESKNKLFEHLKINESHQLDY